MSKRRWLDIILLACSVVFSLLILELAVRFYMFGGAALSYTKLSGLHSLGHSGLLRPSEFQDVLYELRPGLETSYKLHPFRTTADSLRDHDYPQTKPPGTRRFVVLGDSLTMGSGIAIEDAYHSVLERRLSESTGTPHEFINFGVSGYYLTQYLATLRHKALAWDPDVVLIGFYHNDRRVPPRDKFSVPYKVKPVHNGFFKMHSFDLADDAWKYGILYRGRRSKRSVEEQARIDAKQRPYVDATFSEFRELLEPLGIPIVLVHLNNRPIEAGWVETLAHKHGFVFVDTTPAFEGTYLMDYSVLPTDRHPNAAANLLFADTIEAALTQAGLLAVP